MKSIVALMLVAACGSKSSSNVDSGADAVVVPAMITIMGTATAHGIGTTTAVSGATIAAFLAADDSMVTSTTTDASGNYTLVVPTNGVPLDGYVIGTLGTTYVTTYLYPPAPLIADFSGASVELVTPANFVTLSNVAQGGQTSDKGTIGLEVLDATGMTVAGAMVSSDPASSKYRYDSTGPIVAPSSTATSTQADGVAYMFNAPVGAITVSATKAGTTFKSHSVKSWAGALTTTLITP